MTQPTNVTAVYNIVLEYYLSRLVPANTILGHIPSVSLFNMGVFI